MNKGKCRKRSLISHELFEQLTNDGGYEKLKEETMTHVNQRFNVVRGSELISVFTKSGFLVNELRLDTDYLQVAVDYDGLLTCILEFHIIE